MIDVKEIKLSMGERATLTNALVTELGRCRRRQKRSRDTGKISSLEDTVESIHKLLHKINGEVKNEE
jgi:methyl coenzyme M reductase subunit C-like uncharacterized protein (methanogenesis marker protein 7)